MKLVLDTSIVVAALRSKRGASRELLRLMAADSFTALVSVPLFLEYESVLNSFLLHTEAVSLSYLWRPQLSDPADEMVLEAAVNGQADWLVTHNVRHFFAASKKFSFGVAAPATILRKLHELSEGFDYAPK